jgi:Domain of unknown function (DUF4337)
MPEEGIETQELKERLEERPEQSPELRWLTWLSLSTAILAVIAAISSLESGAYANDAIVQKDDAILHQSKADDGWAYYQAKGIEKTVYATQARLASDPALGAEWRASAEREDVERIEIRRKAEENEKAVDEWNEKSEHSLHLHHQFARSVTTLQVAIALAAIAALARREFAWWVSLAVGAAGAVFFVIGLLAGQ